MNTNPKKFPKFSMISEVLNVKKNPIKIAQNMIFLGKGLNYISLIVIINSFPKIVKDILKSLPKNDYPVLNSRLFFECWLSYALDNSLTSMRDLFKRLNNTGFEVDISTFSLGLFSPQSKNLSRHLSKIE